MLHLHLDGCAWQWRFMDKNKEYMAVGGSMKAEEDNPNVQNKHKRLQQKKTGRAPSHNMAASSSPSFKKVFPIIPVYLSFLLVLLPNVVAHASSQPNHHLPANQTFHPAAHSKKLRWIRGRLKKINKPSLKTIQANSLSLSLASWCSFLKLINVSRL